jgi:hypothetical protein
MGRRKITIKQIPDVKLRHITFNKRKNGLFKKAAELSVLCNLNLLLVCEDGLGNLIQFSKNRIPDIGSFLNQCNYQNIVSLTSEDYPDFSKINKKKDKDKDDVESNSEEDETPPQPKEKNTRTFTQMASQQQDLAKNLRKAPQNPATRYEEREASQRSKTKGPQPPEFENTSSHASNVPNASQKKKRHNLRLEIPKAENNQSKNTQPNDSNVNVPPTNTEQNVATNDKGRVQADYAPPRNADKSVDFTSPPFMPSFMAPRMNIYDQAASPFKYYGQNPSLNSVLKGLSPFTFPLGGTPLISKTGFGDSEEKNLLDTANALKFMQRTGMGGPETGNSTGSHKVFTFQHEDSVPPMNQSNSRAESNVFGNPRLMPNQGQGQAQGHMDYMNLPSVMKSEMDFDVNLPPDTLSARRFNFDGYFRDFDETGYNEMRKKYKMT